MVQKQPLRPRGRPRAYDPERALADATRAFWHAGFAATSLDDLGAATGMNRPSLYGAFGDKKALYLAALDRYIAEGRRLMDETMDAGTPLPQALSRVYDAALAMYLPPGGAARGCFLVGTAATEAVADADVRERLAAGLRSFDRAFEARLRRARAQGELPADAHPAALARIASAILHTLALRSRAGDSRASLRATAAAGIALICGTSPAAPATPRKRRAAAAARD
jgi:AcrR family transcriptional regulator